MKVRTLGHLFKQGVKNVVANHLMAIASTGTVMAALFIFGIFYMLIINTQINLNKLNNQIQIVGFIEKNQTEQSITQIQNEVKKIPHVIGVKYVSPKEGLKQYRLSFKNENDNDMGKLLDQFEKDNPIPPTIEIKVDDLSNISAVNESVKAIKGIYRVRDGKVVTDFLLQLNSVVKVLGLILLLILGLTAIFIISNTIKLTVFVRRREISIMKYIGATDWFIRWPFIVEGFMIGMVGALITLLGLSTMYHYGVNKIYTTVPGITQSLVLDNTSSIMLQVSPIILLIGSLMGIIGSAISIRKYLRV